MRPSTRFWLAVGTPENWLHITELVWGGKYKDGKKQGPVRIALPFETVETVNESAHNRH